MLLNLGEVNSPLENVINNPDSGLEVGDAPLIIVLLLTAPYPPSPSSQLIQGSGCLKVGDLTGNSEIIFVKILPAQSHGS